MIMKLVSILIIYIPAGSRVLSKLYPGFPTTTKSAIWANNFDYQIGTTGYSTTNDGDLGLLFPTINYDRNNQSQANNILGLPVGGS